MARRFKMATALNFVGLMLAFAAFYLLMTQVDYSRSYNRCIPDCERVFRIESKMNSEADWGTHNNRPMLEMIRQMPQVESMTLTNCNPGMRTVTGRLKVGETTLKVPLMGAARNPFAAMQTRCIDGELSFPETVSDPKAYGVIIPASLAQKLFGTSMAAGRYVWDEKDSLMVRGVYEDFPDNCDMGNYVYWNIGNQDAERYSEWSYNAYIKLHEGVDVDDMAAHFPKFMRQTVFELTMGRAIDSGAMKDSEADRAEFERQFDEYFNGLNFRLTPITDTYFSGVSSATDKGNPAMLLVLQLASVLVILVAAINFLNFTLAESPMRIKGINTRRVLGEGVGALRWGLVGETVATALVACVLALALCVAIQSQQTDWLQGSLRLSDHPLLAAGVLGLALVVGLAAGVYPAYFTTSFEPALVLKGSFGLSPKGRQLRTLLVGLQLFVSMLMVCYIGILMMQSHYIYTSDYGYDKDELLYANVSMALDKKEAMRSELMRLTGVEDVSFSRFALGASDSYMQWGKADSEHPVVFTAMPVDWHYLRTMGINVVEGRDFNEHDGDVYILNAAARRAWPWVRMGQLLLEGDMPVVGICEDVRFGSVRVDRSAEPLAFVVMGERYKSWDDQLSTINIRIAAQTDKVAMRQQVSELLKKLAHSDEIEVKFLDQRLEQLYEDEFRFVRQVMVFSVICLIITLIGVFCLTMFETEYRSKEIGIRKILGSSTSQVLRLLCQRYVWLVGLSFVVATPLAWYIGRLWLQSFAERTPIYWWLFPLSLLAVGAVTLCTVVIQSWCTARENPINSIKME